MTSLPYSAQVVKQYLGSSRRILTTQVDLCDNSETTQLCLGSLLITFYLVTAWTGTETDVSPLLRPCSAVFERQQSTQ